MQVVQVAVMIILEDIRFQVYETKQYSPADNFLQDVNTINPVILKTIGRCIIEKYTEFIGEMESKMFRSISFRIINCRTSFILTTFDPTNSLLNLFLITPISIPKL